MCKSACINQKIVWANAKACEGIVGRGIPLHTAVSAPVCYLGTDICIIVLLSIHSIEMTARAMQFLCSVMSAIPYYDKDFAKLLELITPYQALRTDHSGRTSDLKKSHSSLGSASGSHLDDMRERMEVSVNDLTQLVTHPDGSVNGSNRSSWSYLCLSDLWNTCSPGPH